MTLLGWHSSIMDIIILCERIFFVFVFLMFLPKMQLYLIFPLLWSVWIEGERERGSRGKWVELAYFQPTLLYSIVPFSLSLTQTGHYSLVPFFLGTWIQMSLKPVVIGYSYTPDPLNISHLCSLHLWKPMFVVLSKYMYCIYWEKIFKKRKIK